MAYVIRHIVEEKHFKVTPDNLSEYPDYPKKTEDISEEEYKVGCPEWTDLHLKNWPKAKRNILLHFYGGQVNFEYFSY